MVSAVVDWYHPYKVQPGRRNPGILRPGIVKVRGQRSKDYGMAFHVPRYIPPR